VGVSHDAIECKNWKEQLRDTIPKIAGDCRKATDKKRSKGDTDTNQDELAKEGEQVHSCAGSRSVRIMRPFRRRKRAHRSTLRGGVPEDC